MTKRFIVATFADAKTLTRTTSNAALRYGWRVIDSTGKRVIVSGFSSQNVVSPDARAALKNYPGSGFQIVDAVVTEKPKAPKRPKADMTGMTDERVAALVEYAAANGRRWKIRLAGQWERGTASPILTEIRNAYGPSWLKAYTLPKK